MLRQPNRPHLKRCQTFTIMTNPPVICLMQYPNRTLLALISYELTVLVMCQKASFVSVQFVPYGLSQGRDGDRLGQILSDPDLNSILL